ncbi:RagB/SusD family nutrient uptake outer membrane protein [Longimicrobium sp.]|uniref:RagB/SusD family nutrient uptake outer membrane protein n=1 Tax=Longimicrobium sp. TaxID=2029185 RepID=UPI002EDA065B
MNRMVPALLLGASVLAGCADLTLDNPNERTAQTFWQTEADATLGVNAAYRGLQENGTYGRWLQFAYDTRSDIGFSRSPWGDLANFTKSVLSSYDFEVNREIWQHHYQTIYRANQVIQNVPEIQMNAATRDRIVGEAKFIRALAYFNLVSLYGNVPLTLTPAASPTERPVQVTAAVAWAQIEKDLTEARAALPASYGGADAGRATSGAAAALLGRALLQQGKWAAAAAAFAPVFPNYQLLPNYIDNFTDANDNNRETIFEVQFGGPEVLAAGSRGQNIIKMMGPCGVGFCDGEPTQWYFDQLSSERTVANQPDPRLDATLFYNRAGGMDVYGTPFATRYADRLGDRFWRKYGEWYKTSQDWDNPINVKVLRLGGVLLMHADALNESGQPDAARGFVNQVRARAGLAGLPAGLSQAQMRDRIEAEILKEMGLENERFLWLKRHGWLTDPARINVLKTHDPDFNLFEPFRALLPIPSTETNLNKDNVTQNPGW